MSTVYISIGNSDDKLSQAEWAEFVDQVDSYLDYLRDDATAEVHGRWFSPPDSRWQNACWCVELVDTWVSQAGWLRRCLADLARQFRQDSIKWDVVPDPEWLTPDETPSRWDSHPRKHRDGADPGWGETPDRPN